jgi:hypothetical protein
VHRVADEADVSSCATLLNGPVSDLEGALRRLSAEEIEQWFDLELELAIRSQKNRMTTMKTKYGSRTMAVSWVNLWFAPLEFSQVTTPRTIGSPRLFMRLDHVASRIVNTSRHHVSG